MKRKMLMVAMAAAVMLVLSGCGAMKPEKVAEKVRQAVEQTPCTQTDLDVDMDISVADPATGVEMDVGVQEAGEDDLAGAVLLHGAGVLAHAHDQPLCHGDVGVAELVGEDVDIGGVLQHQVRRLPPGGGVDDAALFQQLPVDLASVALRHRTTPSVEN